MWCGPLFLQVFTTQLNSTTTRVHISELGSEDQRYDGAMALAAAAVGGFLVVARTLLRNKQLERMLSLLANGDIDIKFVIKDRETTGTKHKHKASKVGVWKVEQPNGAPQPFSDTIWGGVTRDFMTLLCWVPESVMASIIHEADLVALSQKAKGTVVNSEQQSNRAALAYCWELIYLLKSYCLGPFH
jgi:hypothetical protein